MKRRKNEEPNAPPIGERLLTLREAAEVLRLSTRTLREYASRGEIEGHIIVELAFQAACKPSPLTCHPDR